MSTSLQPAPPGFEWVCCRYKQVPGTDEYLDAFSFGLKAWCFPVPVT